MKQRSTGGRAQIASQIAKRPGRFALVLALLIALFAALTITLFNTRPLPERGPEVSANRPAAGYIARTSPTHVGESTEQSQSQSPRDAQPGTENDKGTLGGRSAVASATPSNIGTSTSSTTDPKEILAHAVQAEAKPEIFGLHS